MKKTLLLLLAFALALAPGLGAEVKCSGSPCIDPVPVPADATSVTWTGVHIFNNAANTPVTMSDGVIDSTLTAGRVTFAGASGRLSDDADLTFATDTLTATKTTVTTTLTSPNLVSAAGSNEAISATAPAATTGASQAGKAVTIDASNAVASTDTDSAAAGGSVTITAGNAARRGAFNNAAGGSINLVTGAGIGSGVAGQVLIPNGTAGAPSLSFTSATNAGIYHVNGLEFSSGGAYVAGVFAGGLHVGSSGQLWLGTGTTDTDTGLTRNGAAGIVRVTNGSTGTGALNALVSVESVATTKSPAATESAELYTNGADVDGQATTLPDNPTVGSCYEFGITANDTSNGFSIAPSAGETLMQGWDTCTSLTSSSKGSTARVCAISGGSGGIWAVTQQTGVWVCVGGTTAMPDATATGVFSIDLPTQDTACSVNTSFIYDATNGTDTVSHAGIAMWTFTNDDGTVTGTGAESGESVNGTGCAAGCDTFTVVAIGTVATAKMSFNNSLSVTGNVQLKVLNNTCGIITRL